ncbi:MAG: DUF6607 family protein [Candidatus Rokuibacteriota bacterium]
MGTSTRVRLLATLSLVLLPWWPPAGAAESQLERGLKALRGMTGCYLVDYSYVETEGLRPGYVRDPRVYDVNRDKSVKEWISAEQLSPRRLKLQRILFATDLRGAVRAGSELRHQSEDWEYEAPFLYDFVAPQRWEVKDLRASPGWWTRRVTNLDDGLRYQCAAPWTASTAYPEWSCANFAPVPGRETRDMGRADYNTLERDTRIVLYGGSWLERQENVKTIHADGGRTPLVRETGKNWYVRLPDAECATAQAFAQPRAAFWTLLRQTWDSVLTGGGPFVETVPPGQPPRFMKMYDVEEDYVGRDMTDPAVRSAARERILKVIEEYRVR